MWGFDFKAGELKSGTLLIIETWMDSKWYKPGASSIRMTNI